MFNFDKVKKHNNFHILAGDKKFKVKKNLVFHKISKDFLGDLSELLFKDKKAKNFPDIIAFAFWIRKSNLNIIEKKTFDENLRIGLGSLLHITPTNVPINFCYSFVFGLLTGNSNIVKVPSIEFPQIEIICFNINNLLKLKKYKDLKKNNIFIKYKSENHEISKIISKSVDGRVIWGGDKSINNIKSYDTKIDCIDLIFKDKYSFSLINAKKLIQLKKIRLDELIRSFYNDTYTLDQNACSSPHLIIWKGNKLIVERAKKIFWNKFNHIVEKKYLLEKTNSVDKYLKFCSDAIDLSHIDDYDSYKNLVNRVELRKLPNEITSLKGLFGFFYEYRCQKLETISKFIHSKIQTITYFGFEKKELKSFVYAAQGRGINRIVPIGKALDMGFIWDGYSIDKKLSKVIEIS